jgi:hypothetical protein
MYLYALLLFLYALSCFPFLHLCSSFSIIIACPYHFPFRSYLSYTHQSIEKLKTRARISQLFP